MIQIKLFCDIIAISRKTNGLPTSKSVRHQSQQSNIKSLNSICPLESTYFRTKQYDFPNVLRTTSHQHKHGFRPLSTATSDGTGTTPNCRTGTSSSRKSRSTHPSSTTAKPSCIPPIRLVRRKPRTPRIPQRHTTPESSGGPASPHQRPFWRSC